MGPSDPEAIGSAYRGLDLLATFVIRTCLVVIALFWLDREMAEVTLILWVRLWGESLGVYSYLLLFVGGLHLEASRLLDGLNFWGPRQRTAALLSVLSLLTLVVYLRFMPEGSRWLSSGLLALALIWMAVVAPGFVINHWELAHQGRVSPRRLVLVAMSTGGLIGWLYLLTPWVLKS